MDENLTRGYCQLRMDTPRVETRSGPRGPAESLPPLDRCSAIYLALVVCGAGFLLPYNSFITAVDYYQDKYPGSTIIFDMSLTYICVAFVGVVINNLLVEVLNLHARITFGYILSFSILIAVALCDIWFELFSRPMSYRFTLAAIGVVALGSTVQQSSFYGYTSMLPPRYTQAVMTGESAAGLIVSANRILTKALLPDDVKTNTIIFFIISIATLMICCVSFHVSRRTDFVRFYVSMCKSAGIADDQHGITCHASNPEEVSLVDILDGNVTRDNTYGVLVIQSPNSPAADKSFLQEEPNNDTQNRSTVGTATRHQEQRVRAQGTAYKQHYNIWDSIKRGITTRRRVAVYIWPYMLSIGLAYFVTLCLFPGIESEVLSCKLQSWMPVILIAIFNVFDFIGKILAAIPCDWTSSRLVVCTLARLVLVPLLMICATPRYQPILPGEFWPMIISMVLGITNGYFGSIPMIRAPAHVPDEQKELAGNIMTLSYSIGLTMGSAVAYALDIILGPHSAVDPCLRFNETNITASANIQYTNTTGIGLLDMYSMHSYL